MALSSDDVVNWPLKTGMRGYLVPQVDELLDEVADELDRQSARIRELEAEREAVRNSLDDQFEVEETLRRTLYQAQRAADQTIADANEQAARVREDASRDATELLAQTRQRAKDIIDGAQAEAEAERVKVRSRLQAQEAKLRAVGSQLRRDLAHLHALEQETRSLLRGVHEDRLRALDRPEVDLPDFDEESFEEMGFGEAPVEPENGGPHETIEHDIVEEAAPPADATDGSSADADVEADATVEDDLADDVAWMSSVTHPVDPVGEPISEAPPAADEPVVDAPTASLHEDRPAYLAAVSDAIATIEDNQSRDELVGTDVAATADGDDDTDLSLTDDPAREHQDRLPGTPDDLFGDAPARRRRRSS